MAGRKKQSVDAFGKSWSPIDIPNLEKAVKLYERLNYLNDHFASSLSSSKAIMEQINEQTDIKNELQKMGIKLNEEQLKQVIQLLNEQKKVNQEIKIKPSTSGVLISNKNDNENYYKSQGHTSTNWTNAGKNISDALFNRKVLNDEINRIKGTGSIMSDATIKKVAELNMKNGNIKMTKEMEASASKFNKAASVLQVAVDVFKTGVDIFYEGVKQGFMKQTNTYESTFSNISARTQMTNDTYYNAQWKLNNQLSSMSLYDNIGSSEVQEMWNKLASAGVDVDKSESELFANTIDDIVTQKIVPYLDTSSVLWQQMSGRLGDDFVKQIRGINKTNNELVGNNYATEKVLNSILYNTQPMADEALKNLAQGSSSVTAIINELMAKGMSEDRAVAEAEKVFEQQYRGYDLLTEGSPFEVLSMIKQIQDTSIDNINDPANWGKMIANNIDTGQFVSGLGPGYNSTLNGIQMGAIASGFGLSGQEMMTYYSTKDKIDTNELREIDKKAQDSIKENGEAVTQDFIRGLYQTPEQKRQKTLENMSNELSVLKEKFPTWFELVVTAIKGVGTILTTGLIAKGIGALAGSSVGGSGAGLLASGGGLALGTIAGIAAVGAIATAVDKGLAQHAAKTANDNASSYAGQFQTTDSSGNVIGDANSAGALASYSQQYGRDANTSKWKAGLWDNLGSNFVGSVSNAFNWNGYNENDPVSYNEEKWRRVWNSARGKYDDETMQWVTAVYAMAIMDAGNSADTIPKMFNDANITAEGIKAFMHTKYANEEIAEQSNKKYQQAANILAAEDLYPVGPNRQFSDLSWTVDDLKNWGMYRQGLDSVPYDNYPALLHEGEAVLTASTANELRGLLSEYRENQDKNASIEAAIQSQTTSLIEKLNEIIHYISGLNAIPNNSLINSTSSLKNIKSFKSTTAAFAN